MIGMIGLDHTSTSVEVRGRLAFSGERLHTALRELAATPAIDEVAIVSTCNRVEIYAATVEWPAAASTIRGFLASAFSDELAPTAQPQHAHVLGASQRSEPPTHSNHTSDAQRPPTAMLPLELTSALYELEALDVASHLLRVACGLRSMVVGESQILGQVKEALAAAELVGTVGDDLRALFTQAIKTGKRARTETEIGRADVSVAGLAVQFAAETLGSIAEHAALLIGAGRTSQLCARLLHDAGAQHIVLANRTPEAAAELAEQVGGQAIALSDVPAALSRVDLIISATSAPHLILQTTTVAATHDGRPLLILDLAVPPDIEASVAAIPGITLHTLDTLRAGASPLAGVAALSTADRELELARVERIADEGVREYSRGRAMRLAVPGIAALRRHVDASEQAELGRALNQLAHLSDADRAVVERFGQRLVDKMFHHLVSRIRALAEYDEVPLDITMQVLARLFDGTYPMRQTEVVRESSDEPPVDNDSTSA